ncbi:site-specific integrase [Lysinibacter sp. HNR]|uniref:tyrosine-type recombinase/integrase n=1 Tax=Lysinibacter sp. HNR TaxID=3031408 RepID=UPI002434FB71|nr:site-specific integrase [Lysinibacter sp. HNR]WGD37547.1 site-specific integrase [Lysinibacter sp. HNR]
MASIKQRFLKSGESRFDVIWRVKGDRVPKSVTLNAKDSAITMKTLLEAHDHDINRVTRLIAQSKVSGPMVDELAQEHVGALLRPQGSTIRDYEAYVKNHISKHFAGIRAASIVHDDIVRWVRYMQEKGMSPKTIANVHGFLSSVFKTGVRQKIIETNPCLGIAMPVDDEAGDAEMFLTLDEYRLILEHIPERWVPMYEFLIGTGARFGEASALSVDDFTLDAEVATVRISKAWKTDRDRQPYIGSPKYQSRRTVSLEATLTQIIVQHIKENKLGSGDYIFQRPNGRPVDNQAFSKQCWKKAVFAARSHKDETRRLRKSPTPHDLRHTHISWLLSAGVPLFEVSRRVGHRSTDFTAKKYGHFMPQAQRRAADAMAEIMGR